MNNRVLRVIIRKEIRGLFRDRRIMCLILLLPLLLAPSIMAVTRIATKNTEKATPYRVAMSESLADMADLFRSEKQFLVISVPETQAKESVRNESVDVFVAEAAEGNGVSLLYNSASAASAHAMSVAASMLNARWETELSNKLYNLYRVPLAESRIDQHIEYEDIYGDAFGSTLMFLIPMVILSYCCYGVSSVAGEMTIAESERGTFEPLIASGVNRSCLIIGKSIVAVLFGWASGCLAFLGLYVYSMISGSNAVRIDLSDMLSLVFVAFLISGLFSSLCILIGFSSKSYKEYQAYSSVLAIFSMLPTFFTMTLSAQSVPLFYHFVPLLGHTVLIKNILTGNIYTVGMSIVAGMTVVIACIAVWLSCRAIRLKTQ